MLSDRYIKQAELLLRTLPYIAREEVFAIKGGTAINFFWRNLPRLSVDIDLTYVKIQEREMSLVDISNRLINIESGIQRTIPGLRITQKKSDGLINGLLINSTEAVVKVEVNTIIRGTVFPVIKRKLTEKAEGKFELTTSVNTLPLEDLYGGKICAALDRQHPRDLFDVNLLFEKEGLTEGIVKAFVFYLASHNRPMVELLNPGLQDIEQIYNNEFTGMTVDEVKLEYLISVRNDLITRINKSLTEEQKTFLLSLKNRKPEWELSGIEGIENYPSIRYKLINLQRMNDKKHNLAYDKLKDYLLG